MSIARTYVYGFRAVTEAIRSGREIEKCLIRRGLRGELYGELFTLIRERNIPFQFVPEEKINRITRRNHQGVLAFLSEIEYQRLDQIIPGLYESGKVPFLIALDEVSDVRNFGAIARTAECGGVHAIVIPQKGSAMITPEAVKTSAGALCRIPVCRVPSMPMALDFLRKSGLQLTGTSGTANRDYRDTDYTSPTCIIMGPEEQGLNPSLLKMMDVVVRIPVMGQIESLNVSVAAGVMIYEVLRQRLA